MSNAAVASRVLIVDNQDSFTFNLSQLVAKVTDGDPLVIANTDHRWREWIGRHRIEAIIISPGPGSPDRPTDFGICREVIQESSLPLLGVCLGHQGLGYAYGARVVRAPAAMHGRTSTITHDGSSLFDGMPRSFQVVRYHSLCLQRDSIPACLEVTASTSDGVAMALQHRDRPQFGVQFHPESICAEFGERLIRNFLRVAPTAPGRGSERRRPTVNGPTPIDPTPPHSERPTAVVWRMLDQWIDPQSAFERLFARSKYCFWLDSSQIVPGDSRFSILGDASGPASAVLTYSTQDRRLQVLHRGTWKSERIESLLPHLRQRLARPVRLDAGLPFDFQTGLVGVFGYELRNELGSPTNRVSPLPDAALIEVDRCVVFDHAEREVFLVARSEHPTRDAEPWFDRVSRALSAPPTAWYEPRPSGGTVVATLADGPDRYCRKIGECQDELLAGESYEICLSTEFSARCRIAPYHAYRALRSLNPAPYAAFLRFGAFAVLSSSPERFLLVSADRTVSAKPIKGTSARGADAEDDAKLAAWLRSDEKSRSENLMIVDLLRNDIGRVATTASIHVPKLMQVESFATVHQLVSTVTGRLRPDVDSLDCLAAAFPGGSMTGAPKIRTMSIIDRLEARARGPYSGAVGYLSYGDRMHLNIVIRTIVMANSSVTVASGGGIVALSDPRDEFEEMVLKARAPLRALAAACAGDADAWELRHATP